MNQTVWVVQRECGDYYCGCGGGHIVGIFTDEPAARALIAAIDKADGDLIYQHKIAAVPLNEYKWNADDYDNLAWS